MDYGKIFTRAWQITWRYRALWLFGVLFALFGSSGGGPNFNYNFGNFGAGGAGGGRGGSTPFSPDVPNLNWQAVAIIIGAIACIVLIWFLLSIILRFISRGALIGLVGELETDQTVPTVRRGFSIGSDRFLPLFGIGLVVNIPLSIVSFLFFLIAVLPILASIIPLIGSAGRRSEDQLVGLVLGGVMSSFALLCCVVLLLVVISVIVKPFYEFFVRVCVIARRGAMDSLREGYRIVRSNLGNVAVLYILIIGVAIGFGILMIPVALVLFGIPVGAGFGIWALTQSVSSGVIVGIVIGIPMVLILLFISGIYQVFESTLWTEGFLSLTRPPAPAVVATPPVAPTPPTGETPVVTP